MSWDPRKYDVDDAIKDLAYGNVTDVRFTENGVMKGYKDGHVTDYVAADNDKGHNSYDYRQDKDGIWRGSPHKTNK